MQQNSNNHLKRDFEINRFNLKFLDGRIENFFKREYFLKSIRPLRLSILVVSVLYAGFGWLDFISSIEFYEEFFVIRFYIVLPLLAVVYLLSFTKKYTVIWQHLLAFSYYIAGVGIIYMLHRNPQNIYYYGGMFLIFIGGYFFIKLYFYLATLVGVLLIITYNVSAYFFVSNYAGNFENLISTNAFFISANIIAALALYNIERLERYNFGQRYLLSIKQKEINSINIGLETQVKERTKLLDERNKKLLKEIERRKKIQKKLIVAKEKAEESDRLKSAFLANMSHEIRTPMNGILGFIGLLQDPDISQIQQKEFINLVEKSSVRLLNTINDIIEISKIEAGLVPLKFSTVHINELCKNLYDFFKHEAKAKGIELKYQDDKKATYIKTDDTKLESILSNLIKNAIKFTKEGEIVFGYKLVKENLEFFVHDTGIGIPTDKQQAIFNRFEQANLSDTRVYEGSGLGLAISKAYVEMLDGKIWVKSEENKGSSFFFTIKRKKSKQEISVEPDKLPHISTNTKNINILVVEDDEISYSLIENILASQNYTIFKASNGQEAIDFIIKNASIDIVLMDIKMPVLDGISAVKKIREFDKQLPIIAQTSYALRGDKERALEAGFTDYITKPLVANEFLNILKKYK